MNLLYLSLINIEKKVNLGINKKIEGQIKAIKKQGLNTFRIYLKNSGLYVFCNKKEILLKKSLLNNKYEYIEKRIFYYKTILDFIQQQNIKYIYIRYPFSDLFFIRFVKKCKEKGLNIYLEIATYPYEKELGRFSLIIDTFFRRFLNKYIDNIVTYSNHEKIYGVKAINIENGIDVGSIKIAKRSNNLNIINLIGVASISKWHGFDRVIEGLSNYYKNNPPKKIFFHIVGEGSELNNLKSLTRKLKLQKYVLFHGIKKGKELDEIFEICDIGIGSLGMHRIGLNSGYTLKLREYCARGIPFIYGYLDKDFINFKYSYQVSNDESIIDIEKIIRFYMSIINENCTEEIRKFAQIKLSWDTKMQPVIKEILKNN